MKLKNVFIVAGFILVATILSTSCSSDCDKVSNEAECRKNCTKTGSGFIGYAYKYNKLTKQCCCE